MLWLFEHPSGKTRCRREQVEFGFVLVAKVSGIALQIHATLLDRAELGHNKASKLVSTRALAY